MELETVEWVSIAVKKGLKFFHVSTVFTQGWFDIKRTTGARAPFPEKLQKQLENGLNPGRQTEPMKSRQD